MSDIGPFVFYVCLSFYFVGFVDGFESESEESVGFFHKPLIMFFWPIYLITGVWMRFKK